MGIRLLTGTIYKEGACELNFSYNLHIKSITHLDNIHKTIAATTMDVQLLRGGVLNTECEQLLCDMRTLNRKFKVSCNQVVLLNNAIESLQCRYQRACARNQRSFRYYLRLKLACLEGVRNMLYQYACQGAADLDRMQNKLLANGVIDPEVMLVRTGEPQTRPENQFDTDDDADEMDDGFGDEDDESEMDDDDMDAEDDGDDVMDDE